MSCVSAQVDRKEESIMANVCGTHARQYFVLLNADLSNVVDDTIVVRMDTMTAGVNGRH